MGSQQSPEEIKENYIRAFPNNSGLLGYQIWNDINLLHENWSNYQTFYGTDQDRIDLLNQCAPSFFMLLEVTLRHDIILSIARLTDRPESGRNRQHVNASIKKLFKEIESDIDESLKDEIKNLLKVLNNQTKKIRSLRDKLIAHSDFKTKLDLRSEPLPGVSRAEIEAILSTVRDIFHKIELNYLKSETYFQEVMAFGNAEDLINLLNNAIKSRERK